MIAKVVAARNLSDACKRVVRNKGSAGIDGMPTTALKAFIDAHRSEVVHQLISKSYRPQAIKGVAIPKPNGKTRLLGVPTVVDRWLQQAVSQQLAIHFELKFEAESYGFRPRKNLQQAVLKSQEFINDEYQDVVDIDLKSFFDEVQHYKLLQLIHHKVKCQTTLWLIRKWLRAPILKNGRLHKRRKGLPQGSPLSPLLSNILLDQLDKHLKARGLRFIRYADDFSIYTKSKAAARSIGNAVYLFLKEKLDLPVNHSKSGIRRPSSLKVLGYRFTPIYKKGVKGTYQLVVGKSAWQTLKRKLRYLTRKTLPLTLAERLQGLKSIYKGWLNNFRLGAIQSKLKKVDEWLRNRLRYCIWHDWKKPERKRKNLIRLGVRQDQTYAWSRTRMGGWAVAQSPILRTTITQKRLRKRGFESMLEYYLKVKF
ncbi:group II intron reverse transcriptase/maturase [Leeuwenhoekiella marinoflava]|uniref:RNA-directed DNA polymerase n=2 Tax=Leeuwenhoekiella marinoflava TaxID=988 RepID=A0A4Q0PR54_9FLAO|nr:group II intron reverse transcriptase/maturase [Leeuwenhoekiella marinoflava]RXG32722.1 group II intron reverse transcriptase/maturase [Leeuwenhoekiella marinoflava]SHE54742.1 group II intron reverse transcriptase/maturase [Leeuwenhoekiella marinoflava DSM 3653]